MKISQYICAFGLIGALFTQSSEADTLDKIHCPFVLKTR